MAYLDRSKDPTSEEKRESFIMYSIIAALCYILTMVEACTSKTFAFLSNIKPVTHAEAIINTIRAKQP
jgi:hypothetical protein